MALKDLIREVRGPDEVKPAIDSYLCKFDKLPSNRADGWHVSQFCSMCPRKEVLKKLVSYSEEVLSTNTKLLRIFHIGSAVHRWYQEEYFGPMGILWGKWRCSRCHAIYWGVMPEIKHDCEQGQGLINYFCDDVGCFRYPEHIEKRGGCNHCGVWGKWEYEEVPVFYEDSRLSKPIVGHADGIIYLGRRWILLEIKTINEWAFKLMKGARESHQNQGQVYGNLINMKAVHSIPANVEIPRVSDLVILYIAKNTSEEREFWYPMSEDKGDFLLSLPARYHNSLERRELPNRIRACKTFRSEKAKDCVVANYCFGALNWGELEAVGVENEEEAAK
jgi:hypothetical protein